MKLKTKIIFSVLIPIVLAAFLVGVTSFIRWSFDFASMCSGDRFLFVFTWIALSSLWIAAVLIRHNE